jgi:hypothetical protein
MHVQTGASCLWIASSERHLDVVKYLHEAGAKELLMMTVTVSELVILIVVVGCFVTGCICFQ